MTTKQIRESRKSIARKLFETRDTVKALTESVDYCNHSDKEISLNLYEDGSMLLISSDGMIRVVYKSTVPKWARLS